MKTSLAYIDDVMDRAIEAEHGTPTIPKKDQDGAAKRGRKIIGGFRVRDEAAERAALDGMIAKRRDVIQQFRIDRTTIRDTLSKLGITPLAVCPTGAWYKICRETGLIVLAPDAQGRVRINPKFAKDFANKSAERAAAFADGAARTDWPGMLKRMFPDGIEVASSHVKATIILPDPPTDVADVLCKAQTLKLTVAAVPEAIRMAEKASELMKVANQNPKDLWAQEQGYEDYADWLKRDPIIFTEHGTATAIIAQFGDFPIEKDIVDSATKADDLISDRPRPLEQAGVMMSSHGNIFWSDPSELYRDAMTQQRLMIEQQEMMRAMSAQSSRSIDSRRWTGR